KQLNNEMDARFVGYFGAVGEGVLALRSILAVVTLFASEADFLATYSSFTEANGEGLSVVIEGAANLANGLLVHNDISTTIVSIIVDSFDATTLDTADRLLRY